MVFVVYNRSCVIIIKNVCRELNHLYGLKKKNTVGNLLILKMPQLTMELR